MASLTEEKLLEGERLDWNFKVKSFIGRGKEIGNTWVDVLEHLGVSGELIPFYRATRITGERIVDGVKCLQVQYTLGSTPNDLRLFLDKDADIILAELPAISPGKSLVSGSGERFVDPETLLGHGENKQMVITMKVKHPSAGEIPVTVKLTKTYQNTFKLP